MVAELATDRIGDVIFSEKAVLHWFRLLPIRMYRNTDLQYSARRAKDGTAIGDGLGLSVERLKDSKPKTRIIILVDRMARTRVGRIDPLVAKEMAFKATAYACIPLAWGLKVTHTGTGRGTTTTQKVNTGRKIAFNCR